MSANEFEELHYRNLLVAVDGSENSDLAIRAAVTVARQDNARLTLICVAPDVMAEMSRWSFPSLSAPVTQDAADKYADEVLRRTAERIPRDVSLTFVVKRGRAGPEIVKHAAESTYDAILIGARGVARVEALLGSVSQYVVHNATIPVFVAHEPVTER